MDKLVEVVLFLNCIRAVREENSPLYNEIVV